MPQLLRIDASARPTESVSRQLADSVETRWVTQTGGNVQRRDVGLTPPTAIHDETITGFYTPIDAMTPTLAAATAESDALIDELQNADALLLASPVYNFTVPAGLKAWIDQIVRIGRTFAYDGQAFTGLAKPQRAYLCLSYGATGYLNDGPLASADFLAPYLTFLLGFLGIAHVETFAVEGTTGDPLTLATARSTLEQRITQQVPA
ncbi:MAG: NAD(P)H-dependent oxidoreductase [Pseudomonadota bacterium]